MTDEEEVEQARQAFNEAQRLYQLKPSEATKSAMKVASSAYRYARLKAAVPPGKAPAPPPGEHPSVTEAREKCNEARRAMYAEPGPETKRVWLDADNALKRLRRQHDPAYRAKMIAASMKSRERGKLGLTRKKSK